RLVTRDPARAEAELRETYDLVGETIAQARELAYGRRRLNLSAELENARNLFEAAGIHVRVDRPADLGEPADDLLGQVLRETTTNVLRHSRATLVHVALSEHGIPVVNDGVAGHAGPAGGRRRRRAHGRGRRRPVPDVGHAPGGTPGRGGVRRRGARCGDVRRPGRRVRVTTIVLADDEVLLRRALASLLPLEGD